MMEKEVHIVRLDQRCVIVTTLADGENFFQGIFEKKFPGTKMPMMVNLWTIHFDDLKPDAGIFPNRRIAKEYLEKFVGEGGNRIEYYSDIKLKRAQ